MVEYSKGAGLFREIVLGVLSGHRRFVHQRNKNKVKKKKPSK